MLYLSFGLEGEGQGPAQFVDWLAQLQGVEGGAHTQGDTRSQYLLVGQANDTGVGDLGLDLGVGVWQVLGGELDVDVGQGGSWVQGGPGADLQLLGDVLEEGGGGDLVVVDVQAQVVVLGAVAQREGVLRQGTGGDVVAELRTRNNTGLVSQSHVTDEARALQQVEVTPGGEEWLHERQVQKRGLGDVWDHRGQQLGLQARCQVAQLDLGVQVVAVRPALGQSQPSGLVSKLGLDISSQRTLLDELLRLKAELDTVLGDGFQINSSWNAVVEVLVQQVVDILEDVREKWRAHF